jgi:3-hydroxybutyryl-CoA dehydratase
MKIEVGMSAIVRVTISDQMVRAFAELSGDRNPIHLDEEFAAKTRFGRRIAHGMISAALVSSALANNMPGPGTVYLGQTIKFTAPVYIDEEIEIVLSVLSIRSDKPIAKIGTLCKKVKGGIVVMEGEATVLLP